MQAARQVAEEDPHGFDVEQSTMNGQREVLIGLPTDEVPAQSVRLAFVVNVHSPHPKECVHHPQLFNTEGQWGCWAEERIHVLLQNIQEGRSPIKGRLLQSIQTR